MAAIEGEFDPRVIGYRVSKNEKEIDRLIVWRRDVDGDLREQKVIFRDVSEQMDALSKELRSVKTMLVRFSFSIAGAAVAFAISVAVATGRL